MLTATRIGHRLFHDFSSPSNRFTTSPIVSSLQFSATSVATKPVFGVALYTDLRQALRPAGWMEDSKQVGQKGFEAMAYSSSGWF